jgi:energy-converting hydrogenase A subunit A
MELIMLDYIIYIIAAGSALILGLLFKQPLLPEEPKRQSWTISAIFPTAVLALGFTAMISKLGYLTSSNLDYLIALAIGVVSAFFSIYLLEKILPRPSIAKETPEETAKPEQPEDDSKDDSKEDSKEESNDNGQEESNG